LFKRRNREVIPVYKKYHAVVTKRDYDYFGFPQISEKITTWLNDTYIKYNVNLAVAIKKYLTEEFYNNVDMLSSGSKIKSDNPYKGHIYELNYKKRTNPFNINGYYSRFGNKPFLNGKKKSLEILMMFTWLGEVSGEDAEFFQNYLSEFKEYLLPTDQGVGSSNLLTHVQKTFV
jgi:hypothetical protein